MSDDLLSRLNPGPPRPADAAHAGGSGGAPVPVVQVDARPGWWRRWRVVLVLVPALALLAGTAATGQRLLWAPLPDPAPLPDQVRCWDGSIADTGTCGTPDGLRGLAWVFPSLNVRSPRCGPVERPARALERPTELRCSYQFRQRLVTVTYSRRTTLTRGLSYLDAIFPTGPLPISGGRVRFEDADRRPAGYEAAIAYADHPFAVEVAAPDAVTRDAALEDLVQFRPAGQLEQVPLSAAD
ncbi:hypothetical protein [Nocardioides sp.]|uniref:hypothetical protein n=1 Tax=Nocardioides sp. TaxID=35761 RepID=UPI00351540CA